MMPWARGSPSTRRGAPGSGPRSQRRRASSAAPRRASRTATSLQPRLAGDAGQRLGLVHRLVEAAELVDQAQLLGLGAGPDPALGDLAHPLGRQLAARRPRGRRSRRRCGPSSGRRRRAGAGVNCAGRCRRRRRSRRRRSSWRTSTPNRARAVAERELAAEDADRAGQGGGLGDDRRGLRRDPVAARGAVGAHGDHHRLAGRLGRAHGAPGSARRRCPSRRARRRGRRWP